MYGHATGAMNLAITKAGEAIWNTDNHEYFAENISRTGTTVKCDHCKTNVRRVDVKTARCATLIYASQKCPFFCELASFRKYIKVQRR